MKLCKEVIAVEKEIRKVKMLLYYIAGAVTVKFGGELLPAVMGMLK